MKHGEFINIKLFGQHEILQRNVLVINLIWFCLFVFRFCYNLRDFLLNCKENCQIFLLIDQNSIQRNQFHPSGIQMHFRQIFHGDKLEMPDQAQKAEESTMVVFSLVGPSALQRHPGCPGNHLQRPQQQRGAGLGSHAEIYWAELLSTCAL